MLILMVDNDKQKMNSLKTTLELYGFDIEFRGDVDSVMEYVHQNTGTIDLILLDIMMPNGKLFEEIDTRKGKDTGLHLYRKIREMFNGPILFYTVVRNKERVESFIDSDMKVAYLTKPQEPRTIVEKIYELAA